MFNKTRNIMKNNSLTHTITKHSVFCCVSLIFIIYPGLSKDVVAQAAKPEANHNARTYFTKVSLYIYIY